jgi:hypothetical protein
MVELTALLSQVHLLPALLSASHVFLDIGDQAQTFVHGQGGTTIQAGAGAAVAGGTIRNIAADPSNGGHHIMNGVLLGGGAEAGLQIAKTVF